MSAPTPAPGDDRPREGYYPDPSIPGYVRYWNGASWVPGTSRPAPKDGEPLVPPPGVRAAPSAVEETGPHFFDEDPQPAPASQDGSGTWAPDGHSGPGAWGADGRSGAGHAGYGDQGTAGQAGPGGQGAGGHGPADGRTAWGADPRVPAEGPARPAGQAGRADGGPGEGEDQNPGGTFLFRRPVPGPAAVQDDGTMTFRPVPGQGPGLGASASGAGEGGHDAGAPGGFGPQGPVGTPTPPSAASPANPAAASPAAGPGFGAGKAAARAAAQAPQAQPAQPAQAAVAPPVPGQAGAPATPVTSGPGGGQASWAQQVHRLAGGDDQPVAPWKPPVEDPFQAAARRQAAARPAGLGKRFAARLIDTVVVGAVTAVAAVPLGTKAVDHVQQKIDAARLSGREVTVWLLDGTTATSLGIVLAVLLLAGVGYEVLPTARWGRTLGKKLLGLEVRDIEAHEPPAFGAALRRWLVYSVPGLLGIGILGVLWCLFDRPWHQCWHDKAAHTFVAG
ncbi:RDD family protein [Streptomyces sp. CA-142005]|uniref:RDD family protein n=1 Tax=Streptomyces sp. CA-142005 TaxID=3240052 RepID=UPI003D91ADD1